MIFTLLIQSLFESELMEIIEAKIYKVKKKYKEIGSLGKETIYLFVVYVSRFTACVDNIQVIIELIIFYRFSVPMIINFKKKNTKKSKKRNI